MRAFWTNWQKRFIKPPSGLKVINGATDSGEIATLFAEYFKQLSSPNINIINTNHLISGKNNSNTIHSNYVGDLIFKFDLFEIKDIINIVNNLKLKASPGPDTITPNHIKYANKIIYHILTQLINLTYIFGYVPRSIFECIITPIPKTEIPKNIDNVDNFRGITNNTVFSKIIERSMLLKFANYFRSSDHQFGFKKGIGCGHSIYSLSSIINHFTKNDSTVNICAIDINKAFNKINFSTLREKLMQRNLPNNLLSLITNFFNKSTYRVKWKDTLSERFKTESGVPQGGILSPFLFNIYINEVIDKIIKSNLGCQIGETKFSIFMYADDLILIAGSIFEIQKMIDLTLKTLNSLALNISKNKTQYIRIGANHNLRTIPLNIDNVKIYPHIKLEYLGVEFTAGRKLSVNILTKKSKYYRSFNSIYSKATKADECVLTHLISQFCAPIALYGLEALRLSRHQLNTLKSITNYSVGKIFNSFNTNIINNTLFATKTLPLHYEYIYRKIKFIMKAKHNNHSPFKYLFTKNLPEEYNYICSTLKITSISELPLNSPNSLKLYLLKTLVD